MYKQSIKHSGGAQPTNQMLQHAEQPGEQDIREASLVRHA